MADKKYPGIKRIIAQDRHRNGIGGAPAVVSLFTPEDDMGVGGTFVAISFIDKDGGLDADLTYAVNLEQSLAGNIAFAEGNSWRAADYWGPGLRAAYADAEALESASDF